MKLITAILVVTLLSVVGNAMAESIPYSEVRQIKDEEGKEKLKNTLLAHSQFQEYAQWGMTVDSAEKYPDGGIRAGFSFMLPSGFSRYGLAYRGSLWVVFWDDKPETQRAPSNMEELKEEINEFEDLPQVREFVKLYQPQSGFIDAQAIMLTDKNYIWGYHIIYHPEEKKIITAVLNPNFQYESFPEINQMIQGIRNYKNFPEGCLPFEGEIGFAEIHRGYFLMRFDKKRNQTVYAFNTNHGKNCADRYFVRLNNGVVEIEPDRFWE